MSHGTNRSLLLAVSHKHHYSGKIARATAFEYMEGKVIEKTSDN